MGTRTYGGLLIVALAVAFGPAGCQTEPIPVKATRPPPPPREESKELPPDKRPSMAGEYLVYPVKWRHADEVAAELYQLLFPKYGPYLSIVPDRANNTLLIYLPPRASRYRSEGAVPSPPGPPEGAKADAAEQY
jgi:hypothetical protein